MFVSFAINKQWNLTLLTLHPSQYFVHAQIHNLFSLSYWISFSIPLKEVISTMCGTKHFKWISCIFVCVYWPNAQRPLVCDSRPNSIQLDRHANTNNLVYVRSRNYLHFIAYIAQHINLKPKSQIRRWTRWWMSHSWLGLQCSWWNDFWRSSSLYWKSI